MSVISLTWEATTGGIFLLVTAMDAHVLRLVNEICQLDLKEVEARQDMLQILCCSAQSLSGLL